MLQHIEKMLDKALEDIEGLGDASREMKIQMVPIMQEIVIAPLLIVNGG